MEESNPWGDDTIKGRPKACTSRAATLTVKLARVGLRCSHKWGYKQPGSSCEWGRNARGEANVRVHGVATLAQTANRPWSSSRPQATDWGALIQTIFHHRVRDPGIGKPRGQADLSVLDPFLNWKWVAPYLSLQGCGWAITRFTVVPKMDPIIAVEQAITGDESPRPASTLSGHRRDEERLEEVHLEVGVRIRLPGAPSWLHVLSGKRRAPKLVTVQTRSLPQVDLLNICLGRVFFWRPFLARRTNSHHAFALSPDKPG